MQNSKETRSLNGITNVLATDVKSTRILTVGGLLVCTKTRSKMTSDLNGSVTVSSTLVEVDTQTGATAGSLSNIYLDGVFGETIPDGTLIRLITVPTVVYITLNETGNIVKGTNDAIEIRDENFSNFIWVSSTQKWVRCSGTDCCIC
jgi:hypothetical protein